MIHNLKNFIPRQIHNLWESDEPKRAKILAYNKKESKTKQMIKKCIFYKEIVYIYCLYFWLDLILQNVFELHISFLFAMLTYWRWKGSQLFFAF